jgi:hypothetical protein
MTSLSLALPLNTRERKWLSIMGWLVGLALFIRATQILPCCAAPSMDSTLRHNACESAFTTACPRYEDCAPR